VVERRKLNDSRTTGHEPVQIGSRTQTSVKSWVAKQKKGSSAESSAANGWSNSEGQNPKDAAGMKQAWQVRQ